MLLTFHISGVMMWAQSFVDHVDCVGIAAYLEGTPIITPLAQQHGFVVVGYAPIRFDRGKERAAQWESLVQDLKYKPINLL